jgi:hypothetical protein
MIGLNEIWQMKIKFIYDFSNKFMLKYKITFPQAGEDVKKLIQVLFDGYQN